jgi:hypothetical protein
MSKELKLKLDPYENLKEIQDKSVSRTTCLLFYMSKSLNIEMSYLQFIYNKFGDDMFYFFYMLAGKKITIPKEENLCLCLKM